MTRRFGEIAGWAFCVLKSSPDRLFTIQVDGVGLVPMAERVSDSEKITINLGHIDLGHIDLMVQEGFYSNRTDFIRTAIRNQLERHAELGLRHFSREDLEEVLATRQQLHIRVLGLASIANDVTPELARATIGSIAVLGALHASSAVKTALADRIR